MQNGAPENRWFHLCMADDLASPNAFATTRVGAVPLVAQNIKGRVVAFRNVCTHRFAVIHGEPAGCGPLRCPYHGWSFDADGVPVGLPFNPTDFQLEAGERRRLALHPASLAQCGRLVFVRVAADGPSLEEELGAALFARLAALSDAFPRHGETAEPAEDWETIEAANLRLHLAPDRVLVLHSASPPGADQRFSRTVTLHPATADAELPA
ncbi:phenylpropionate dioxygenase-like ring-hydroxylating dioxygenase large terminal subunit [Azospirillum lipoferum]|uniref:Rieske 2Fe-2S domain-containing protein n=1 Tax=Azospirillum lipoferum TaxID=193 RepID=A0A5A9GJ76_AZOLI|nr:MULTISPECIES: Rieske 2Fe-2S domain-containing protein [Azospirillum]KAA0593764.1 Rieske 2Fe-2S domain-containing protein [Azospirillum lipoferum]MCP1614188.1 phenylpropionate dioxygenase-like ring-hydroxylating dioxygenase large terminal subunit [Azospirillum lipoferum]MDW5536873.1 Rieske 2Fe-2S domain-containing protein [Azospirillum sp. NL1]